ncbi:bifunctional P-loop containing nucleoside triphosphate hydrolase/Small GTPase superfamily [Babesia duncani]|uniref:Bifunctional P-loop containing nucleoside triphosphate hydrolase/Small GTPase superfamily n=1 Tax=Babesia duncani TaxID=323732 RepID=A0AAD9PH89_9APIC|nr:bifunctional P-loop containing nucleoside triphosphate hydrolase/Small GTPase superfamily [Babesia duncani]KAK2197974.1 bifunctional P-loop containing nucleoside triphosphate hydrolase/Small GTPase superfamily [Babesia duncani]
MGLTMSSCYRGIRVRNKGAVLQVRVMGLSNAGKTSIINYIKSGNHEDVATSNKEFDMEWATYKKTRILLWVSQSDVLKWVDGDLGGPNAVILVVDGTDRAKFPFVRDYLATYLATSKMTSELLVLINKSDRGDYTFTESTYSELGLDTIKDRHVMMISCSAFTGQGISEALDWLCQNFVVQNGSYLNRTRTL